MIQVTLYSFSKKENSTKVPSGGTNFTCVLLERCSISQPVLKMRLGDSAPSYNYAYIPSFSRYYFIQEWEYVEGLWWAHCVVDVLATYKTEIGASSQYVTRSASAFNGYIPDGLYSITDKMRLTETDFDSGWDSYTGGFFYITVLGTNDQYQTYHLTYANFTSAMNQIFGYANDSTIWSSLSQGVINSVFNPTKFIGSIIWSPVALIMSGSGTIVTSFYVGNWEVTNVTAVRLPRKVYTGTLGSAVSIPKHPQASSRGVYCNTAPFTKYVFHSGWTGDIELDSTKMVDADYLRLTATTDLMTGLSTFILRAFYYDSDSDPVYTGIVGTFNVQMGVPIPTVSSGTDIAGALSGITRAATGIMTAASGGATAIASGIMGAGSGIVSAAMSVNGEIQSNAVQGCFNAAAIGISLYSYFYTIADDDNTNHGRPLMEVKTINTLSGYLKVENAEIAIADATAGEITQIKTYLEGGLYYE